MTPTCWACGTVDETYGGKPPRLAFMAGIGMMLSFGIEAIRAHLCPVCLAELDARRARADRGVFS